MDKEEFATWQARTENSRFKWTEDEIYRLNGRGVFYYMGGVDGIYMAAGKDGTFVIGTYEGAIPHHVSKGRYAVQGPTGQRGPRLTLVPEGARTHAEKGPAAQRG